jgi:hypothetical protein
MRAILAAHRADREAYDEGDRTLHGEINPQRRVPLPDLENHLQVVLIYLTFNQQRFGK